MAVPSYYHFPLRYREKTELERLEEDLARKKWAFAFLMGIQSAMAAETEELEAEISGLEEKIAAEKSRHTKSPP